MSPRGRSSFAFQIAFFKLCRFYSLPKQEKEVSLKSSLVFYDESCMLCLHDSPSMTRAGRATLDARDNLEVGTISVLYSWRC